MELTMNRVAYVLGRALLPLLFIVYGIQKVAGVEELAKKLSGYLPLPAEIDQYLAGLSRFVVLAYAVAALEIICAAMIIIGFKARWAAVVLIVYVGCSLLFVHNFWDMEGAAAVMHRMQALMNISVIGGLLLVFATGTGPMDRHRYP
jgi:putative oxidoreductase